MKVVLAMSGGMDSTLMYAMAKKLEHEIITVTFNYGSKHNKREREDHEFIYRKFGNPTEIILADLDMSLVASQSGLLEMPLALDDNPTLVVPGRNLFMISHLVLIALSHGATVIGMGMCTDDYDGFPDCRSSFIKPLGNAIVNMTGGNLSLWTPLITWDKTAIVKQGTVYGIPWERTYSCYTGEELHCGLCHACRTRKAGFLGADIVDPTLYGNTEA